jgi:hypothetical protein
LRSERITGNGQALTARFGGVEGFILRFIVMVFISITVQKYGSMDLKSSSGDRVIARSLDNRMARSAVGRENFSNIDL